MRPSSWTIPISHSEERTSEKTPFLELESLEDRLREARRVVAEDAEDRFNAEAPRDGLDGERLAERVIRRDDLQSLGEFQRAGERSRGALSANGDVRKPDHAPSSM